MSIPCPWPDRDDTLRKLWDDGMSARDIGEAMTLSKNSIIGRAHRLELAARPSPIIRRAATDSPAPCQPPRRLSVAECWPDAAIARLCDLWTTTTYSRVQIGERMGRSQHSVGAKLRDLYGNYPTDARVKRRKPVSALSDAAPMPPMPQPRPAVANPGEFVLRTCQFPMWGHSELRPKPARFCGEPVWKPGKPWCAACHKLVFHSAGQADAGEEKHAA